MKKISFLALLACASLLIAIGLYGSSSPSDERQPVNINPTDLTEQAINNMVSTRIEKIEVEKPTLPEEFKTNFTTVEKSGSEDLALWLSYFNEQMMIESAIGTWVPGYVKVDNNYYVFDTAEKMHVEDIKVVLDHNGMLYQTTSRSVDNPVSCNISGYDIVSEDNFRLHITSYGCLEYECKGYSILLVKE